MTRNIMVLGALLLLVTFASAEGQWIKPSFVPFNPEAAKVEQNMRNLANTYSLDNALGKVGATNSIIVFNSSDGSDVLVGGETAIKQSPESLIVEGTPYDVSDLKYEISVSYTDKVLRLLTVKSEDSFLRKLSDGNTVDLETFISFSNISILNKNSDTTRSKIVFSDGTELDTSDQMGKPIEFKSDATAKYKVNDFELIQPYAVNGKGERINLDYSITLNDGGATVDVHLPMKWILSSPLPITIDPSWVRPTVKSSNCGGANRTYYSSEWHCSDTTFTNPTYAVDTDNSSYASCISYLSSGGIGDMYFNTSTVGKVSNISVTMKFETSSGNDGWILDNCMASCYIPSATSNITTFYCGNSTPCVLNSTYQLQVEMRNSGTNCNSGTSRTFKLLDVELYVDLNNANISLASPANVTSITQISSATYQNFSFNVQNGTYPVSGVQLWGNFTGAWALVNSTTSAVNGSVILSYHPPVGSFIWTGIMNDSKNNKYTTVNSTFYVTSNPVPSVGYTAPYMDSGSYLYRNYIYEQISCSDVDLQNQTLHLYDGGGSLVSQQWSSSNIFIYNWTTLSYGSYYANGSCYDTINQVASAPTLSIVLATTTTTTTLKANGISCSASGDCTSGNCVDGVCCSTACLGNCQRCSGSSPSWTGTNGTCSDVPVNQDPDSECDMVGCDGGATTPYFDDWASLICYWKLNVSAANAKCDGGGGCISAFDYCSSQPQGGTTGVECNCVAAEIGCGYTTAGSCNNALCSNPGISLNSPANSINVLPGTIQVFIVTPVQGDNALYNVTVFLWNASQEICGRNSSSSISSNVPLSLSLRVSGYGTNKWNAQVYDNLALSSWGAVNRTLYATTTTTTTTTLPPTSSTIAYSYETPAFHALMSLDMKAFYNEVWWVKFGAWIYVLGLFPIILVMYVRTNSILYTAMVLLIMLGMLAWVVLPAPVNIFAFVLIILGIGSGLYKLIWS